VGHALRIERGMGTPDRLQQHVASLDARAEIRELVFQAGSEVGAVGLNHQRNGEQHSTPASTAIDGNGIIGIGLVNGKRDRRPATGPAPPR
jgi:hypothetical protein